MFSCKPPMILEVIDIDTGRVIVTYNVPSGDWYPAHQARKLTDDEQQSVKTFAAGLTNEIKLNGITLNHPRLVFR